MGIARPEEFGGDVLIWSSKGVPDRVELTSILIPLPKIGAPRAAASRVFHTSNRFYRVVVRIELCENFDAAEARIKKYVAESNGKLEVPPFPETLVSHIDAR